MTALYFVLCYCVFACLCALLKYSTDKSPRLWQYSEEPLGDYFWHALPFSPSFVIFMITHKFWWQGLVALVSTLAVAAGFVYFLPPTDYWVQREGYAFAYGFNFVIALTALFFWGFFALFIFSKKTIGINLKE